MCSHKYERFVSLAAHASSWPPREPAHPGSGFAQPSPARPAHKISPPGLAGDAPSAIAPARPSTERPCWTRSTAMRPQPARLPPRRGCTHAPPTSRHRCPARVPPREFRPRQDTYTPHHCRAHHAARVQHWPWPQPHSTCAASPHARSGTLLTAVLPPRHTRTTHHVLTTGPRTLR